MREKWKTNEINTVLNNWAHKFEKVFLDLNYLLYEEKDCENLMLQHKNLYLLLHFGKKQHNFYPLALDINPNITTLLNDWRHRICLGHSFDLPESFRHKSAMKNYATRMFTTIRNFLELEKVKIPVSKHAHKEWGYPYEDEKEKNGLGLSLKTLKIIYNYEGTL